MYQFSVCQINLLPISFIAPYLLYMIYLLTYLLHFYFYTVYIELTLFFVINPVHYFLHIFLSLYISIWYSLVIIYCCTFIILFFLSTKRGKCFLAGDIYMCFLSSFSFFYCSWHKIIKKKKYVDLYVPPSEVLKMKMKAVKVSDSPAE